MCAVISGTHFGDSRTSPLQECKLPWAAASFVITPNAVKFNFTGIFDDELKFELWAYNIETVLAEKVETILRRNVFNTRPRDFYDTYILITTQEFDKKLFAEALEKTIERRGTRNQINDYLSSMEDIAEDYRQGRNNAAYPQNIAHNSEAKSFYGSIRSGLKKAMGSADAYDNEATGVLALQIKDIVAQNAKRDWRDNVIVHRNIKKLLDDALFDYMEDNNLDWSLDTIDIIIDEIMLTAKKVY